MWGVVTGLQACVLHVRCVHVGQGGLMCEAAALVTSAALLVNCLRHSSGALAPTAAAPATGCCNPQLLAAWHRTIEGCSQVTANVVHELRTTQ
jgi:hypothetical protein